MTSKEYIELKDKVRKNALKELILSQHDLTIHQMVELLELIPDSKIEHLDLSKCNLGKANVDLAAVIKKCPRLRYLDLSRNDIEEQEANVLLLAISKCMDLRFLDLRDVCIKNVIDTDMLALAIAQCQNLQHLDIRGCSLGVVAVALSSAIAKCAQLQFFALNCSDKIGSGGMAALASAIAKCTQLQYLFIEGIDIDVGGAAALASVIPQLPLQELTLNTIVLWQGNYVQREASALAALKTLAPAIAQCSQLRLLCLRKNDINNAGVEALVPVFENCRNMQHLDLSVNNIGDGGIETLALKLAQCSQLKYLDLHCNIIDVKGAAAVLNACRHLVELDLCDNVFRTEALTLVPVIAQCLTLEKLKMLSNRERPTKSPIAARFDEVVAGIPSRRALLTFLYAGYQSASASTGAAAAPAVRLVKRDGDNSIMRRVFGFLLGG